MFLILAAILLVILSGMGRMIYLSGGYLFGPAIGPLLCPAFFVISLMVGIACGLRNPSHFNQHDDEV